MSHQGDICFHIFPENCLEQDTNGQILKGVLVITIKVSKKPFNIFETCHLLVISLGHSRTIYIIYYETTSRILPPTSFQLLLFLLLSCEVLVDEFSNEPQHYFRKHLVWQCLYWPRLVITRDNKDITKLDMHHKVNVEISHQIHR